MHVPPAGCDWVSIRRIVCWVLPATVTVAMLGVLGLGGAVHAGQDPRDPAVDPGDPLEHERVFEPVDQPELYAGVDVVSQYVSRGIVFSSKVLYQPWAELHVPVPGVDLRNVAGLDSLRVFGGTWHSFQGGGPGLRQDRSGSTTNWYEADLYAGVSVVLADVLATSVRYNYYPGLPSCGVLVKFMAFGNRGICLNPLPLLLGSDQRMERSGIDLHGNVRF